MTLTLTPDAQLHLDRYLKRAKEALRGRSAIDADEVERDVLGHIDAELAGQPQPIGADRLVPVLERLGTPDDWVDDDEPQWRRAVGRLRSGPEDWRLAYLTIGSFVLAVGLFMSIMLWPLPPLLIAVSIVLARVTLSLLDEDSEPVGARRWLIYPPLAAFYAAVAAVLIAGPLPFVASALFDGPVAAREAIDVRAALHDVFRGPVWLVDAATMALVLGAWWVIFGLLTARFANAPRVVFWPFADWFKRRHAVALAIAGLLIAVASAAILFGVKA